MVYRTLKEDVMQLKLNGKNEQTEIVPIKPLPKMVFSSVLPTQRDAMLKLYTCPNTGVYDQREKKSNIPHFTIVKDKKKRGIIANLHGKIPLEFANYMANHGMDVDKQTIRDASHKNGGHPCLRTVVNMLQAEMWMRIHKVVSAKPGVKHTIICLGDKFN
jgi:hypothetical protein